ncbi:MAG: UDP-N-acetylglucosamine pyrophosphorylase [Desulfobacteraceae bacterium]|nr:MAG: UDP-N-acetylglucosamine pyrophosphorylase [Desulfobacteraceae bacterium]
MELKPSGDEKIKQLVRKGVTIPNPLTLDIGEEVDIERISGDRVTIYPGCRIYGAKTVVASGAQLGYEGPVTIENCQIGPKVELKGGYFKEAVFLEGANMGLAAHVREGCILEEQAGGAHCVGLKQTILFPFVTLGSLINFCDCFMAGGTSRKNHSEVGSSYIHFNFTPSGDKTTPSLVGDVPRGVMLNQPAIFLGGQGGMVGPLRLGYGNVVAAGTILRQDFKEENKLIVGKPHRGTVIDFNPYAYPSLSHVVENNFFYLANLMALEQWYLLVRRPFFGVQELGEFIYAGLLDKLNLARKERIKRLKDMAGKIAESLKRTGSKGQSGGGRQEFHENIERACEVFSGKISADAAGEHRDPFLTLFFNHKKDHDGSYLEVVKSLPPALSEAGTLWLDKIILELCRRVAALFPSLDLFKKTIS